MLFYDSFCIYPCKCYVQFRDKIKLSVSVFVVKVLVLSNVIDLSNAYSVYGQCTRHNYYRKVFGGVRKMYGHLSTTVIAQWSKAHVSNLLVVRSSQHRSIFVYIHFQTLQTRIVAIRLLYLLYVSCLCVCFGFAVSNEFVHALIRQIQYFA